MGHGTNSIVTILAHLKKKKKKKKDGTSSPINYYNVMKKVSFVEFRYCQGEWRAERFPILRCPDRLRTNKGVLLFLFSLHCTYKNRK